MFKCFLRLEGELTMHASTIGLAIALCGLGATLHAAAVDIRA